MRIAVIIPTLDEEARIARQLQTVSQLEGIDEVIVVDGGSADRTVAMAGAFPDVRVLSAERGRGRQMNAGARAASADVFLFLHADVEPPRDVVRWIRVALKDAQVVAGAFRTRTVAEGRRGWARAFLWLADIRSRYTSLPYGDQGIFVRANAFRKAGGFPELPLMEDLELGRRLRRLGRIRTVPATVRVSGRRFLARPLYYILLVNLFPLLYRLGTPPRLLVAFYGDAR